MMRRIRSNTILLAGIGLAAAYWLIEAAVHVLLFREGGVTAQLFTTDPHELWMRSLTCVLLVGFGVYAQITLNRHRRIERTLRESEERYRAIAEDTPVLICRFLLSGEITYVNNAYCTYFAKTPEELLGSSFLSLIPEADRETVMDSISALTVESSTRSHEHKVIAQGGEIRWQRRTNRALFDAQGQAVAYQSIGEDITERKRAEGELRFRAMVLDSIWDGVTATDLDGRITYVNQAELELTRRSREELIGQSVEVYGEDPAAGSTQREIIETTRERGEWSGEIVNRTSEGDRVVLDCRTWLLRDDAGQPVGMCGVSRDITKRKRAEEELEKLASIVRHSRELINLATLDGRMIFLNEAGGRMLGMDPENVSNMQIMEVIPEHLHGLVQSELLPALMAGGTWQGDLQYRNVKTNGITDVHATTFVINDPSSGKPVYLANVSLDITERKRAEEELAKHRDHLEELVQERTQELEESRKQLEQSERLASLGTLAGGLAHEINNPVGVILLAANNVLERMGAPGSRELIERSLKNIVMHAGRCDGLVKDVLQFARQARTAKEPADLNSIINDAVTLTAEYVGASGSRIETRLADALAQVSLNRLGMEQVFVNLIHNAVEAGDGPVRVVVRTEPTKTGVRATVEDNGRGISHRQLEHLFDPFFTTRRESGGTGLGLSIAYGIIASHGGTMGVQSTVGVGTTFTIDLPFSPAAGTEVFRVKSSHR